jgi:DNA-binding CsgD family transcriptional regulator
MVMQHRNMRRSDVSGCVEMVASHPTLRSRYGRKILKLGDTWQRLLGREAFRGVVFENVVADKCTVVGMGVSVFVRDDFVRRLKAPPFPWLGPLLTKEALHDPSPLLSDSEVRTANSTAGLNVAVWEAFVQAEFHYRPEVQNSLLAAFVIEHRGYLLKEAFIQAPSLEQFRTSLEFGGRLVSCDGSGLNSLEGDPDQAFVRPHLIAMSRETAVQRIGNWIGYLFVRPTPVLGMRPSEQRLLLEALRGGTDEELSEALGLSLSSVKKTWRSIYSRIELSRTGILPISSEDHENGDRGKGKKHRLLNYVREHPEELRPISMKLLRQQQSSPNGNRPTSLALPRHRVGRSRST